MVNKTSVVVLLVSIAHCDVSFWNRCIFPCRDCEDISQNVLLFLFYINTVIAIFPQRKSTCKMSFYYYSIKTWLTYTYTHIWK